MKTHSTKRTNRILSVGLRAILPTIVALAFGCKHSPFDSGSGGSGGGDPKKEVDQGHEPTSGNEPTGFTPIANREFKALDEDHWIHGGDGNAVKFMSDQTAPQSKPSVGDITIPAGFSSGSSPVNFERTIRDVDHLYANYWFKVSANWEYNPIFDGLFAFWGGDEPRLFVGWRPDSLGKGMHPAALVSTPTGGHGGSLWLNPNLITDAVITPGPWHNLEVLFESKTGPNGTFNMWLDGKKIMSYTNVPYNLVEEKRHWDIVQVGASWGGLTPDPVSATQKMDIDHIYMSGKALP